MLYTETDLKGIPFPNKEENRTCWLPNDILPNVDRDGYRGILLIEELTSAPKRVQAAAYQLIQDRKLGEYILPENWFIVALGNKEDDNGVYVQMPSPLANRFEIHTIDYDLDIWKKNFAYKYDINPWAVSYLNFKPSALHNFIPDSNTMIFASPRTWHAVSDILNTNNLDMDSDILRYKIEGNVGEIECNSFLQFCKLKDELASVDDIIAGSEVDIPTEQDRVYLLIGSVISKLTKIRELSLNDEISIYDQMDSIYINKVYVYSKKNIAGFEFLDKKNENFRKLCHSNEALDFIKSLGGKVENAEIFVQEESYLGMKAYNIRANGKKFKRYFR